jgi:hypothetical protein
MYAGVVGMWHGVGWGEIRRMGDCQWILSQGVLAVFVCMTLWCCIQVSSWISRHTTVGVHVRIVGKGLCTMLTGIASTLSAWC